MKKQMILMLSAALLIGFFFIRIQYGENFNPDTGYRKFEISLESKEVAGLGAVDIEGDGTDELAILWGKYVGEDCCQLMLYKWDKNSFKRHWESEEMAGDFSGLKVVDLDADGKDDVLVCHEGLKFFRNNGKNLINKGNIIDYLPSQFLLFDDLDGDGLKDLAVGAGNYKYIGLPRLYKQVKGKSSGRKGKKPVFKFKKELQGITGYNMIKGMKANNDNKMDILNVEYNSGRIFIFKNKGKFKFSKFFTHQCNEKVTSIEVIDMNNDGYDDIAFSPWSGFLSSFINHSGKSFEMIASDSYTGHSFVILAYDINNDSRMDLIVPSSTYNKIYLYKSEGKFKFEEMKSKVGGETPDRMTVGDFNGDRRPDIAFGETKVVGALDVPHSFGLILAHVNKVIYTENGKLIIKGKNFNNNKDKVKIDGKSVSAGKIASWSSKKIIISNYKLEKGTHTCLVLVGGEGSTPLSFKVQ